MWELKQSTAIDYAFLLTDANGDAVTGKVTGDFTKSISKAAAAFGTMTVTITERSLGVYHLPLDTGHTDTNGFLTIVLTCAGAKQVTLQFLVVPRIHADLAFPLVSGRGLDVDGSNAALAQGVNVVRWNGTVVNSLISGRVDANAQVVGDKTGYALTSGERASIADAVWDEAQSGHTTAGTFGKYLDVEVSSRAVPGDVPSAGAVADAVWDEDIVAAHGTADTAGRAVRTLDAISDRTNNANLDALLGVPDVASADVPGQTADEVWDEAAAGHTTAGTFGKRLDADVSTRATPADVPSAGANADAVWDEARAGHVGAGTFGEGVASVQGNVTGSAASVTGSVGSVAAGGITSASFAAGAVTAAVIATGAIDGDALAASAVDAILDEAVEGAITLRQMAMLLISLANKVSGAGTGTIVYKNPAGTKDRITMTVDASGNRSAVTYDFT
jgi:hypothetical protein